MSSERAEVRQLLSALRDPLLPIDEGALEERRQRVVPEVLAQVRLMQRQRERARRRFRAAGAVGALAAAAGALFWLTRPGGASAPADAQEMVVLSRHGAVSVSSGAGVAPLEARAPTTAEALESGDDGSVVLRAKSGLELGMFANTRVRVAQLASLNQLTLERGSAWFKVPHQRPGEHFAVLTSFGRVLVHGTAFSVDLNQGRGCVRVTEGKVMVEHRSGNVLLEPGQAWGCAEAAERAAPPALPRPSEAPAASASAPPAASASVPAPAALPPRGNLRTETALLEAALAAERRGEKAQAQRHLAELMRRFPESRLVPEARTASARLRDDAAKDRP